MSNPFSVGLRSAAVESSRAEQASPSSEPGRGFCELACAAIILLMLSANGSAPLGVQVALRDTLLLAAPAKPSPEFLPWSVGTPATAAFNFGATTPVATEVEGS